VIVQQPDDDFDSGTSFVCILLDLSIDFSCTDVGDLLVFWDSGEFPDTDFADCIDFVDLIDFVDIIDFTDLIDFIDLIDLIDCRLS
jgi:hypothetical protein